MTASYRNIKNSASKNYVTYELQEDLPLSDVVQGTLAFVKSVSSLYVYDSGWQPIQLSNEVPTLDNVPPATVSIPIGGSYSIDLAATDPDGLPISWSYEVIAGSLSINTLNLSQNTFSFSALDDTSFTVRFTASDSVNTTTSETAFTITNQAPSAPTLVGGLGADSTISSYYHTPLYEKSVNSYTLTSTDPEGATPSYSGSVNSDSKDNIVNWSINGDQLQVISDFTSDYMFFDIAASDGKYSTTSTITLQKYNPNFNFINYEARIENPSLNLDPFSRFGDTLDIHADRIIVGAFNDDDNPDASFSPSAYGTARIYKIDQANQTVTLEQQLESAYITANSQFGEAVAIYDDVAFVSLPRQSTQTGLVEIFTRSGTTWTSVAQIQGTNTLSQFGWDISLCKRSGKLAIAEPGRNRVHIYTGSGSSWTLSQTITAPTYPGTDDLLVAQRFGEGVHIDKNQLIIGIGTAYHQPNVSNASTNNNGAVCYYEDDGSGYALSEVFSGSWTEAGEFGHKGKLAIFNDQMIIGCPGHDNNSNPPNGKGRVFMYEKNSLGVWENPSIVKTYSSSSTRGQREGEAVAIWDKTKLWTSQNAGISNKPRLHKRVGVSSSNSTTLNEFSNENDTGWRLKGLAIQWDKIVTGGDHGNSSGGSATTEGLFYYYQAN